MTRKQSTLKAPSPENGKKSNRLRGREHLLTTDEKIKFYRTLIAQIKRNARNAGMKLHSSDDEENG